MLKNHLFLFVFLFTISFSFGQKKFDKWWTEVENLELEGKPMSAYEAAQKILKKADRKENSQQFLKAFLYVSKYKLILKDNSHQEVYEDFVKEIEQQITPNKQILSSFLAESLKDYYNQNSYKIRRRTQTDSPSNQFESWSEDDFKERIINYYNLSLSKKEQLIKVPLTQYTPILKYGDNYNKYQSSLYDILADRKIEFLKSSYYYFSKTKLDLEPHLYFSNPTEFSQINFETSKTYYSNLEILREYQNLTKLHLQKNDLTSVLWVTLNRLDYLKNKQDVKNKDSLYLNALKNLNKYFADKEDVALINLKFAQFYYSNANKNENLDFHLKSIDYCNKIIIESENINTKNEAVKIKNAILSPNLSIKTKEILFANQENLALVNFKNTDTLHLTVYKIASKTPTNSSTEIDSVLKKLHKTAKIFLRSSLALPKIENHYNYYTEVLIPSLPTGNYILCFSNERNLDFERSFYKFFPVQVSNLNLTTFDFDNDQQLYVTHRKAGVPISDVKIIRNNQKLAVTDRNGLQTLKGRNEYYTEKILLTYLGDTLKTSVRFNKKYNYSNDDYPEISFNIFTDRSIYRPGQEVYFKAIAGFQNNKIRKVVPRLKLLISLYDEHYDLIDSLKIATNDFGSVDGKFKLPSSIVTGDIDIEVEIDEDYYDETESEIIDNLTIDDIDYDSKEVRIKVEEYKRPKFEVALKALDSSYVLNQKIKVDGNAKAFFGGDISHAKVTYTIDRSFNHNYEYNRSSSYIYIPSKRILSGETKTGDKGKFTVNFIAHPDSLVTKTFKPIFNYEVTVNVTDINGETRSTSKTYRIGYNATEVSIFTPTEITLEKESKFIISATDLNNLKSKAQGEIKIFRQKTPTRILANRDWNAPEIQQIPKEKFVSLFPNTPYDKNDEKENWKEELIKTIPVNIDSIAKVELYTYNDILTSGDYKFVFEGKGKLGFPIESEKNIKITNPKDDYQLRDLNFLTIKEAHNKSSNNVELNLYTPIDSLAVLLNVAFDQKLQKQESIILKKGENKHFVKVPKGIELVELEFIYHKNLHFNSEKRTIKTQNKQSKDNFRAFNFHVLHFSNKLEPRKDETWQLQLLDKNNQPVSAEVLVSMYDASLDEFRTHNWNEKLYRDNSYNYYSSYLPSFSQKNDRTTHFHEKNPYRYWYSEKNYSFTEFLNFGYDFTSAIQENKNYIEKLIPKNKNTPKGYVSGVVTDDQGIPLPGVDIIVKGTTIGVQTDFDGYFILKADKGSELVFSYVGFETKEAKITSQGEYNILLDAGNELDEVVVTAYGTTERDKLTSAVSVVTGEELTEMSPTTSVDKLLQGKAAGVYITAANGQPGQTAYVKIRGVGSINKSSSPLYVIDGVIVENMANINVHDIQNISILKDAATTSLYGSRAANGVVVITTKNVAEEELAQVQTRTNLQETAFFFPQLRTNEKGEVSFEFTSPEALTRWKFQAFAHDKNLYQAKIDLETVTQKDLNIIPNFPRFFRSKDKIVISAKVNNLSKNTLNGIIQLEFTDEITQEKVQLVTDTNPIKNFSIAAKGNSEVSWMLNIPENLSAVRYRIVAKADKFSDGEESIIPVLNNRIFVTETLPVWVNPQEEKTFTFENLKNNNSTSLENHQLIFEFTSNPVWAALQSLPYLIEFPHECSEQTFARFYSNHLAGLMVKNNPEIKETLENWKDEKIQLSDLYKNEELKNIALEETPWLKSAESKEKQQKRLAQLLSLEESEKRTRNTLLQLKQMQLSSGAFTWFSGGRENRNISIYILQGLGRLQQIDNSLRESEHFQEIIEDLIKYLDKIFIPSEMPDEGDVLSYHTLPYLYARGLFESENNFQNYTEFILESLKNKWVTLSIDQQLTLALIANRYDKKDFARKILISLKENAVINSDYGMYWKEVTENRGWFDHSISTQVKAIEAFHQIDKDEKTVTSLKTWLLRNKKINAWDSTKSTTEAIYALLLQGEKSYLDEPTTKIKIGDKKLENETKIAKTGYLKVAYAKEEISSEKAIIEIENKNDYPQYGGMYWQYFEESDAVKANNQETLSIQKQYFKKEETNEESKLVLLEKTKLQLGDVITVRLIISAKEDFSFMHLKDMRAASLEPVDVLSTYKWQDGLGYYQSTKDVATHFFFDHIKKGTYVFEYDLLVNNLGDFSNGITTLQNMYAPEYKVQTKGSRLSVEK
ncbi:TonB-dependent receptor plug domain-containing protein [Mesonia sp. K7]|uniref:alpha-2-macroglobulin family protein n=1 Tax=Mesonia sp. K7 TaxID=2218606 RepID=UPI000DA90E44|nr:TonB-dependent receptor plug domain-containing protein [Mesonia sp. K7]PZD76992.1 hypothetical protein DNG35_10130 [Mesonia sp. K7]